MTRKKAVLIFPDGVGVRNYLYSEVFKNVDTELIVLHNFDDDTEKLIAEVTSITKFYKFPKYKESVKEKFFRELICLSRLKYNAIKVDNQTILTNWKTKHQGFANIVFYNLISKAARKIKDYQQILNLEKIYQKSLRKNIFYNEISTIFDEIKPDLIFCAHQRALQCATIFAVAQDRNITTSTVIYSWDNLPKARMALRADQYLVWSEYMKKEMSIYYPEIPSEKIIISGTPQFEFYNNDEHIISKDVFYSKYKLDPNKKIICFSGDDIKTSPDDPKYLFDLASEITNNNLANDYQILLRRCPVDISGRFDSVVSKFPNLIKEAAPIWKFNLASEWSTVLALPKDISLLVSTAFYSDIVINLGSTMAFDFAMFKKPCIFIAYDQEVKTDTNWSVETIYNLQHFRSMPSKSAVHWWKKRDEICELVKSAEYPNCMNTWKEIVLSSTVHSSSQIATALKL